MSKDSRLYKHAISELRKKGMLGTAEPMKGSDVYSVLSVIDLVDDTKKQDKIPSDILDMIMKLLNFQPLSPLRGTDDEWESNAGGGFVNKRCPRVIKDSQGKAWDTQAVAFEQINGLQRFTDKSPRAVSFPYMPITRVEKA